MKPRSLVPVSPWSSYSKKLLAKIEQPRSVGVFTQEEATARGMRLCIGREGSVREANAVILYWLVDESDGVIADAKFQVYGPTALIGAAEVASELLMRKNYDQARRISADLIDKQVRDKSHDSAFPAEASAYLNLVLFAIEEAAEQCLDIPLPEEYVVSPVSAEPSHAGDLREYPGWKELSTKQKIAVIEEVIDKEVRPYIELDAGGVRVLNLLEDREVIIAYEGACTSCHSATGSTLTAIQQILRTRVHPSLTVTPDSSFLN